MKRIISFVAVAVMLLLTGQASAQISIQAGYLAQQHNVNIQSEGQQLMQDKAAWMQGGFIGVTQNLPMFANISLAPGAYISFSQVQDMMLFNRDSLSAMFGDSSSVSASSISLKIPFLFNLRFGRFFIFGGPTFNVSLSTVSNLQSINDIMKAHYDMGAAVGAGVRLGSFRIYAGYNAGLIDREHFDYSDREAWSEAWEGSTLFAGVGLRL